MYYIKYLGGFLKTREWIENNLFNRSGYLSSGKLNKKWFVSSRNVDKYNDILFATLFLDENSLFSERIYCILNNINYRKHCDNINCNNNTNFLRFSMGYNKFCCCKCANSDENQINKMENTFYKKYGVKRPSQSKKIKLKKIENNIKKYGEKHYFQSDEFKQKTVVTNKKKYGVRHHLCSPEIRKKIKDTWINNYGVDNPQKDKHIREKTAQICLERYGHQVPAVPICQKNNSKYNNQYIPLIDKDSLIKMNDFLFLKQEHHDKKKSIYSIAFDLGVSSSCIKNKLDKHEIEIKHYQYSRYEKEIINFINVNNIQTNTRDIIFPLELDIYLPDYKLAVEFNGLYWHSKHPKNYHLNKTRMCEERGIQLLHIFENEWIDLTKQGVWKSIISGKLGRNNRVYARKTEVRKINDDKLVKEFINNNHLQGFTGSSIKLGLFYKNELISIMTFGKTRFSKNYQYEMIRFCNKIFISVIGGASKLYKYFVRNYRPESVVSYADRRYSNGDLYEKLGFIFSHYSTPNYWYFNNDKKLYSRMKFQKHKLKYLLENFDKNKSEIINMLDNGYLRIFDCGNKIMQYNPKSLK